MEKGPCYNTRKYPKSYCEAMVQHYIATAGEQVRLAVCCTHERCHRARPKWKRITDGRTEEEINADLEERIVIRHKSNYHALVITYCLPEDEGEYVCDVGGKRKRFGLMVEDVASDTQLQRLAVRISMEWRLIGRFLGLNCEVLGDIENYFYRPTAHLIHSAYNVLRVWMRGRQGLSLVDVYRELMGAVSAEEERFIKDSSLAHDLRAICRLQTLSHVTRSLFDPQAYLAYAATIEGFDKCVEDLLFATVSYFLKGKVSPTEIAHIHEVVLSVKSELGSALDAGSYKGVTSSKIRLAIEDNLQELVSIMKEDCEIRNHLIDLQMIDVLPTCNSATASANCSIPRPPHNSQDMLSSKHLMQHILASKFYNAWVPPLMEVLKRRQNEVHDAVLIFSSKKISLEPIMLAIEGWDFNEPKAFKDLAKLMKEYKEEIFRTFSPDKYTILHACMKSPKCVELFHFMLQVYPKTFGKQNLRRTDQHGNNFVHYLCQYGEFGDLAKICLSKTVTSASLGDLFSMPNDKGETPILVALKHSKDEIAMFLKGVGVSTLCVDNTGKTILHYILERDNPMTEVAALLIRKLLTNEEIRGILNKFPDVVSLMERKSAEVQLINDLLKQHSGKNLPPATQRSNNAKDVLEPPGDNFSLEEGPVMVAEDDVATYKPVYKTVRASPKPDDDDDEDGDDERASWRSTEPIQCSYANTNDSGDSISVKGKLEEPKYYSKYPEKTKNDVDTTDGVEDTKLGLTQLRKYRMDSIRRHNALGHGEDGNENYHMIQEVKELIMVEFNELMHKLEEEHVMTDKKIAQHSELANQGQAAPAGTVLIGEGQMEELKKCLEDSSAAVIDHINKTLKHTQAEVEKLEGMYTEGSKGLVDMVKRRMTEENEDILEQITQMHNLTFEKVAGSSGNRGVSGGGGSALADEEQLKQLRHSILIREKALLSHLARGTKQGFELLQQHVTDEGKRMLEEVDKKQDEVMEQLEQQDEKLQTIIKNQESKCCVIS